MNINTEELKRDTIVYNRDGARAKFISKIDNYYFVIPEIEYQGWEGDIETDWGNATQWREIFIKPPTEILDEAVVKRNNELKVLDEKVSDAYKKINESNKLITEQKDKFARYERLKYLEDFIDGKINYLVRLRNWYSSETYESVTICEFKDAISRKDDSDYYYRDKLKFVTLFGDTKGNLNFCLSEYYMERDYKETVIPCKSYNEALEVAQKAVNEEADKITPEKGINISFINSARKLGLGIPIEMVNYENAQKEKARAGNISRLQEQLEKTKKELEILRAGGEINGAVPAKY